MALNIDPTRSRTKLKAGWNQLEPAYAGGALPVLSFFTGAGFLDLGFEAQGFEAIWHNEIDPSFIEGFEFGVSRATGKKKKVENTHSIVDAAPDLIFRQAFGERRTQTGPGPYGLIGGPPCPDFSVAGKNRGEYGKNGKLSGVYVKRILELNPTFFVFENVKGLVSTVRHREFLQRLINELEESYRVDFSVLNALELGIPQDRQRVFMVGFHEKWIKKKRLKIEKEQRGWFPWPVDQRYKGAKKRFDWPTKHPFGSSPEMPGGVPVELTVWSRLQDSKWLESLPNGLEVFNAYSQKFLEIAEGDSSRKSFKRLHRWRYSPTAAYGNNEVHLHPTLPRRLTVREALRIQTAPDSYALPPGMTLTQKFKTIGNAVPVDLASALAFAIRNFLEG